MNNIYSCAALSFSYIISSVNINLSNTVFALLWFFVKEKNWRLQQHPHFYLAAPPPQPDAELLPLPYEEKLETRLLIIPGSHIPTLYAVRDRAAYIFQTVGTSKTYGNIWNFKGDMVLRGTGYHTTFTFPDEHVLRYWWGHPMGETGQSRIVSFPHRIPGTFYVPMDAVSHWQQRLIQCARGRVCKAWRLAHYVVVSREIALLNCSPIQSLLSSLAHRMNLHLRFLRMRTVQHHPHEHSCLPNHHQPPLRRHCPHQLRHQHTQSHNRQRPLNHRKPLEKRHARGCKD